MSETARSPEARASGGSYFPLSYFKESDIGQTGATESPTLLTSSATALPRGAGG